MNNIDIRSTAQARGIRLWQIATRLNLNDGNFSRKLRKELSPEEKGQIMQIIEDLAKESA